MKLITRRGTFALGAGALAASTVVDLDQVLAQVQTKNVTAPDIKPEKGASIRIMRPTKFIDGDQQLYEAAVKSFTEKTGVEVKTSYESWEDLRPKTAVSANIGSGPDIVWSWLDDAHQFPEKLVDLSDVAGYIGEKHGGWWETPMKYGRTQDGSWIAMPVGAGGGCINYRKSWLQQAGFESIPDNYPGMLKVFQGFQKIGHPGGLTLGNAVGDGNTLHWLLWGHGGKMVDEKNNVVINSPETIAALEYMKELYATFIPGTLTWLDPNNNKAFLAGEVGIVHNGISIYWVAKNSQDPKIRAIADDMDHARPPMGPIGQRGETSLIVNAFIFKHTKFPNAAKAFLLHFFETEQYTAWQTACTGYWQPTLKAYDALPFWTTDPKLTPFRDIVKNMKYYGYSGQLGYASAAVLADYVVVQMFASVASGQATPKDAAAQAEKRASRYYRV
jgi:multiple sugar transport system substrate-binding protein